MRFFINTELHHERTAQTKGVLMLGEITAPEGEPEHSAEGCCRCCIAGKGQAGGGAVACLVTPVPEGRGDTTG